MYRFLLVATFLVASCGGDSENTGSRDSTSSPQESTSLINQSSTDVEITDEIRNSWETLIADFEPEYTEHALQKANDTIFGIRAKSGDCTTFPPTPSEVGIFEWKQTSFVLVETLEFDGDRSESDLVQFVDVTDDDIPELVVEVFCYEFFTTVYSVGSQGIFEIGQASYLRDGVLTRYEEPCQPDCAAGAVNFYQLAWNGRSFDEILIEKQLPYVIGRDFAGQDLSGWDMEGWDLTGADLNVTNLLGTNLRGANLSSVNLASANLKEANLANANLTNAYLYSANFSGANLEGADLRGADLLYTDLSGANLLGANLTGVYLDTTDLTGATMPDGSIFVPGPDYNPRADGCYEGC